MDEAEGERPDTVIGGLQRRLLLLLLLPLGLVGLVAAWVQYQSAGTAALQQDQQLLRLVPMLADSVVVTVSDVVPPMDGFAGLMDPRSDGGQGGLALLLAPPVEEFLKERDGYAAFAITDAHGRPLLGDAWLPTVLPLTQDAEFMSVVEGGVTYRVVAQRSRSAAGDLIVMLADGSDASQHWLRIVMTRVLLPNLLLFGVVIGVVSWAVSRALRPLMALKQAVERRSPRDLSPIEVSQVPAEVRPLVDALNRLFGLVNAQADAQRRFVADAAHQLRTPLAGLQAQVEAWAQAARRQALDGVVGLPVEQVARLRDATRRTSQLANQLLALSRADSLNADTQPREQVDLKDLCENILALQLDAAAARRIDLGLETQAAHTVGHAWLLRELLINLVDNAIKYIPSGGHVTLRCAPGAEGTGPWLEVEDDGPGIEPHELPRVLQRFYRLPGTQGEGNGLGLAIADEIARAHRTQLQLLQGVEGRGLRVRVVFPARPAAS